MEYPCIVFPQRPEPEAPKFCVFQAPVGEILEWTTIPQLSPEEPGGIQRAKNDYKVRAIKSFVGANPRNTIPTAIVVTLAQDTYTLANGGANGVTQITIDPAKKVGAFVVDGQHRLYGLNEFSSQAAVPVVAILSADNEEKAFQFIVINNKVSKVSTDHIRALALNLADPAGHAGLEGRLKAARLSLSPNVGYVGTANEGDDSPFKGLVSLPDTPEDSRVVVPAAIESAIAYIQSKRMRQLVNEEDSAYEFFISIWSTIKASWPAAFTKNSKLLTKVGLFCMTRYVADAVDFMVSFSDHESNLSNSEDVTKAVGRVLALQEEKLWLVDWSITISDTKTVRDEIDEALKAIQQNIRYKQPWFSELKILKSGAGHEPPAQQG